MISPATIAFALSVALAAAPASQPVAQPAASADLKIRVVYAHSKSTSLDPKLTDLLGSLKNLTYTAYELKSETSLGVKVGGETKTYALPTGKHLEISALAHKKKGKVSQLNVQLEIPELKFKTKAWISAGATLVIGGPKFEDGVLLFAVGAASIKD